MKQMFKPSWKNLITLQLSSQCFWDYTSISLLAGFIGILILRFLWKIKGSLCKYRNKGTKVENNICMELSFSYKVTVACSILLLGNHTILIFPNDNRSRLKCESEALVVSSEIIQITLWAISLLALYNISNKKYSKFHWILRAWWASSFMLSLGRAAFDNYDNLRISDFLDLISLFPLTWLLGISIQGKTRLIYNTSDEITDPLLKGETDNYLESQRECLFGKATIFQLVTFSWLNPLFSIGIKKCLDQEEVPDIDNGESARFLSHRFDEILEHVKERDGTETPSIYKAVYVFIRKKAIINAIFAVTSAAASYVGPYLINSFVSFLNERKNRSLGSGYLIALGFLSAKIIETISQRQWVFGARQLGLRLRVALTSQIYKKGLLLSSQSRKRRNSGEIINYMSVDVQRIRDFIWYLNIIWQLPVQISLAVFILYKNLGLGSLVALAATLTVMGLNIPITKFQKSYQCKVMEAKDDRMKATSEILKNIKILKLQAWDTRFLEKLDSLRKIEYNCIWKSLRLGALSAFIFWGSPTFISVITFGACVLMGIPLTAGRVLSALATFRMLQDPIFNLPDLLSTTAQSKVSADRIASYLQEEEINLNFVEFIPKGKTEFDVEINDGTFTWDAEFNKPTLRKIDLKVKRGIKVAICGTVGSGKSSLLSSILGEMTKISGRVKLGGTKAYVAQSPWILSGNLRENILFGNPYDSTKYERTVQACALEKDFELFSAGDLTEIGERGINLSGGQKQRIQIARAVYQDADIYLFDDPFSAVDAHTGTQLFEECLMGILKDKTVLYVTHQIEFLPAADLILVMQNGKISQKGTFEELLNNNIGFEILVGAHNQALESLTVENSNIASQSQIPGHQRREELISSTEFIFNKHVLRQTFSVEIKESGGKLVQDEEREKGSIGKEVYWSYLTAVKGGALVPIIVMAQLIFQILQIASNYWMAWACPPNEENEQIDGVNYILLIYTLLAIGSSFCVLVRAMLVATTGILTSQKIFTKMMQSVLRAPMSFFDSTPTGRILNRASTDQSVLDMEMANRISLCAFSIIQLLGTIAVMSQAAWEVFFVFVPITAICIWYQRYYIPTARELGRLAGIELAPVLHHFGQSLSGAATIRAFNRLDRFIDKNLSLVDNHSRPWFHNVASMEWLSFRLNQLANFVFAFTLVLLVTLPDGIINPSIAGLAVTYGVNLNVLQASVIWNICNAENKMISVERILQYSNIPKEADLVIEESRPPNNWPEIGTINFTNLQIRYAKHLPSVLENITCTFPGKKKIGVVGRTGSGKSTLIQAIFRIVEPTEGSILIDNIDILNIGLHDLRSRLSIIPQDPVLFEGTIRLNLDPLEQYSDEDIWEVLDKCQTGGLVRDKEARLSSMVVENGENWSVGQRQLICLGRALLKRGSILVLDEATASVDFATDGIIQNIISQEFKDRTIISVAHRIHTVIDSDFVLVLNEGRVAEFDTPAKLRERDDSFFSKLINGYSLRSQSFKRLSRSQD